MPSASLSQNAISKVSTVLAPPTIHPAFGAANVPLSGSTSLTFTLANPNGVGARTFPTATRITGIGFHDVLPAGLVVSTPSGLSGSCVGGTVTAAPGSGTITLAGIAFDARGTCTSVNVTGVASGRQVTPPVG